jgi:cytochrome P450
MDMKTSQRTGGSFAGTTFYPDRGPSVDDMPWCTSHADVDHVFRSRDWEQGGGGARDSKQFIGDGLLALSGADHFQRRRIEAVLFRKPNLRHYEDDVLLPVLRQRLEVVRGHAAENRHARVELRSLMRSCLYRVSAAFVGLDGVDDSVLDQYFELIEELGIGTNMEWVVRDHRKAMQRALVYKASFMERFFQPSWAWRADLVARFQRGEITEDELPLDLITVMIRNADHFQRWAPNVYEAEALLFHGGPVNSVANAIPHTVTELSRWLIDHPGYDAALTDPAFLRLCCNEALRLHPPTPFFIRRAVRDTTLPSGLNVSARDYIVLDIIAASRDVAAFGGDADRFNPYRASSKGVKSTGIAFGGGAHTCIAMGMTIGDSSGNKDDTTEPVGLMVSCLRELYQQGMRPDSVNAPEKSNVNVRDEYESYWVTFETNECLRPCC